LNFFLYLVVKFLNMDKIGGAENEGRVLKGELYYAFVPGLTANRQGCSQAYRKFNQTEGPRRKLVEL
jgi:hypothetical protein